MTKTARTMSVMGTERRLSLNAWRVFREADSHVRDVGPRLPALGRPPAMHGCSPMLSVVSQAVNSLRIYVWSAALV